VPPDRDALLRDMPAYGAASRTLNGWIARAQTLGVLRTAPAAGVLDALCGAAGPNP